MLVKSLFKTDQSEGYVKASRNFGKSKNTQHGRKLDYVKIFSSDIYLAKLYEVVSFLSKTKQIIFIITPKKY